MANEPAFPVPKLNNGGGLTKREYIEVAAMQALIMSGQRHAALIVEEAKQYAVLMTR